jgi:hypothetical protein
VWVRLVSCGWGGKSKGSAAGRGVFFVEAFLVLLVFFLVLSKWPIVVASELGGCFLRDLSVSPGKGGRKVFSKAVSMVEVVGEKSAAWE